MGIVAPLAPAAPIVGPVKPVTIADTVLKTVVVVEFAGRYLVSFLHH